MKYVARRMVAGCDALHAKRPDGKTRIRTPAHAGARVLRRPPGERLHMKFASCDNCAHRKESACTLGMAPAEGEFLCPRYAMTEAFRDELLALARKEFQKDVNQAMLHISVMRAEKAQAFAG
jgi:hypothetical protein